MPIISPTERKTLRGRFVIAGIYSLLIVGGLTMLYPFMMMVNGALSTEFDVDRRSPMPRFLWSREDRFMRFLCSYFPTANRSSMARLRSCFRDLPEEWRIWSQIGDDTETCDAWAVRQLAALDEDAALKTAAEDYRLFVEQCDLKETLLAYHDSSVKTFLLETYGSLAAFNAAWEMTVDDFSKVRAHEWRREPIDQAGYVPPDDQRQRDLIAFKSAYRSGRFAGYLGQEDTPAAPLRPASLAFLWEAEAGEQLQGVDPATLPFPVPEEADPEICKVWERFLLTRFPMRHIAIEVTPEREIAFRDLLLERFRNLNYLNRFMAARERVWTNLKSWDQVPLTATVAESAIHSVWVDFVRSQVPVAEWRIRGTLPEAAFQAFAIQRHGNLAAVNKAYGLELQQIEQLRIPFRQALLITFLNREWTVTAAQIGATFRTVLDLLILRGHAVGNTAILVLLAILTAVTVNPLAGYALSRFRMRHTQKILVFFLGTTAFPAAVAAIPGFLLLRDLGLLNTFAALVLPGAANGMAIFLLKGFFDSLPQELYEAATIDGASELQIFWRVSLPLVKPILAVGVLNAFIAAYNGWAWAIMVCQDKRMWTLAVWTYQFYQTMGHTPQAVMAAFLLNSIPVFVVFLCCQKIILRGIILPTMK